MKCSHGQPDPTESTDDHGLKSHRFFGSWICRQCGKERCNACGTFKKSQICGLRCLNAHATRKAAASTSRVLKATAGATTTAAGNLGKYLAKLSLFYLKKAASIVASIAFLLSAALLGAASVASTYSKTFSASLRSARIVTERILSKVTSKSVRAFAVVICAAFRAKLSLIRATLRLKLSILLKSICAIEALSTRLYLASAKLYEYGTAITRGLLRALAGVMTTAADILAVLSHVIASPVYLTTIIYNAASSYARRTIPRLTREALTAVADVLVGAVIFPVELVKFFFIVLALSVKTIYIVLHWSISLLVAMIASQRYIAEETYNAARRLLRFTDEMLVNLRYVLIGTVIFHIELVRFFFIVLALSVKTIYIGAYWIVSLLVSMIVSQAYVLVLPRNMALGLLRFTGEMLINLRDVLIGTAIFSVELVKFFFIVLALSVKTIYIGISWSVSLIISIAVRLTTIAADEVLKLTTYVGALTTWLLSSAFFFLRDVTLGSAAFSVGLVVFLKALGFLAFTALGTIILWTTGFSLAMFQSLYVSAAGTIQTLLFASTVSIEWVVKLIYLTVKTYRYATSEAFKYILKNLSVFIRELPSRLRREAAVLKTTLVNILRVRKELPIAIALLLSVIAISLVHMQVGSGMSPGRFIDEMGLHLSEKNRELKTTIATTIGSLPSNTDRDTATEVAAKDTKAVTVPTVHIPEEKSVVVAIAPLQTKKETLKEALFKEALPPMTDEVTPVTPPDNIASAAESSRDKNEEVKLASIAPETIKIPRPAIKKVPSLLKLTPPDITRGNTDSMKISITFDGGSMATETAMILETLKAKNIKTTIFLAGSFIKKYPALVRRMVRDGHEVGNHTMNHPHLTTYNDNRRHKTIKSVTKAFLKKELDTTAQLFKKTTGQEMAPLWRAPYGEVNSELRGWAFDLGYIHIGWTTDRKRRESLDTLDWVSDKNSKLYLSSSEIRDRVLDFGKGSKDGLNGGIVLMHLGTNRTKKEQASNALSGMIDKLRGRGYSFVKVSALLPKIKKIQPFLTTAPRIAMNEPPLP